MEENKNIYGNAFIRPWKSHWNIVGLMNWSNPHQQVVFIKVGYKEEVNAVQRLLNFCQWGPSSQNCEWPSFARFTQPLYSINSLLMIEKCLHRAVRNFVRPLPENKYLISIWCAFDVLIWLTIAELWVLFFRNSDTYFPCCTALFQTIHTYFDFKVQLF